MLKNKMGQVLTTLQFFIYGKIYCTKYGYKRISKQPDYPATTLLTKSNLKLNPKVYLITGSTSGIGKEVVEYLVSHDAIVYMVCRSCIINCIVTYD